MSIKMEVKAIKYYAQLIFTLNVHTARSEEP